MTDKKNEVAELTVALLELVATNYENKIVQLTKERDEARKEAEYWHRRFFMTDCYDGCDPLDNGWRPLKWGANGEAIYTEPPVEDEDCDGGDAHCVNLKYPGQTAQQVADHKMDGDL